MGPPVGHIFPSGFAPDQNSGSIPKCFGLQSATAHPSRAVASRLESEFLGLCPSKYYSLVDLTPLPCSSPSEEDIAMRKLRVGKLARPASRDDSREPFAEKKVPKLEDYLPEELEVVLSHRLIARAWKTVSAIAVVVLGILGGLGYLQLSTAKSSVDKRFAQLDSVGIELAAKSEAMQARTESLVVLSNAMQKTLDQQDDQLKTNQGALAAVIGSYTDAFASSIRSTEATLAHRSSDIEQHAKRSEAALTDLDERFTEITKMSSYQRDSIGPRLAQIQGINEDLRAMELQIAQNGVQTIGAGQLRRLFGTPYKVFFSGVTENRLRELQIYSADGDVLLETHKDVLVDRGIPLQDRDTDYVLTVVNVLDIPSGLFIKGSRTDAASFHIKKTRRQASVASNQ